MWKRITIAVLILILGIGTLVIATNPELLILIPLRVQKTISGSVDSVAHSVKGDPYLDRYESEVSALQCDGFKLSNIEQLRYDDQTKIQKGVRLWYVPERGPKREIGSGDAGNFDFPVFAIPQQFTWFEPVENHDPHTWLSPVRGKFYVNMIIPGLPATDADKAKELESQWSLAAYFSPAEYEAIRQCVSANPDALLKGKMHWIVDHTTGEESGVPVTLGSITYIPWISEGGGTFSERHPYSYSCPDSTALTIAGDNSVRWSGRPIGYLDERGYFKTRESVTEEEDVAVTKGLAIMKECRNEQGRNIEEVYAEWRAQNAQKLAP